MGTKRGGERVEPGLYWCRDSWEIVPISGKPAPLPGSEKQIYHRVPTLGMVLVGPVLGGLFVVFLPFIGFGLLAYGLGSRSLQLASSQLRLVYRGRKMAKVKGTGAGRKAA